LPQLRAAGFSPSSANPEWLGKSAGNYHEIRALVFPLNQIIEPNKPFLYGYIIKFVYKLGWV
jgi:hypothetical protein